MQSLFGDEVLQVAHDVVCRASELGVSLGCAESCTGGLVCGALTSVAGASACVRGAVVSYAVPVKESLLGVDPSITQDDAIGVVSSACAAAMAEGAQKTLKADLCVSITGIAGPGGAEPGKPVGTVWFGLASAHFDSTHTVCKHFDGNRDEVRLSAVLFALKLIHAELLANTK